jgi:putative glutamine amidotransferase
MLVSMTSSTPNRVKIGIPWRTSGEEAERNRPKIESYEGAVREAGAEAVLLPLSDPEGLAGQLEGLDGFVLPGSPADVEPEEYGARNTGLSEPADKPRERTDWAILEHALREQKPVLAICYGCQSLNVYLGGTLVQDVRWETGTTVPHRRKDVTPEAEEDPKHEVRFAAGSRLASLNGGERAVVNSSHHQSVQKPGRDLRITGRSSDGIVESVEWAGDGNWVVGVQWHPERMKDDALARRLFLELVAAVESHVRTTAK